MNRLAYLVSTLLIVSSHGFTQEKPKQPLSKDVTSQRLAAVPTQVVLADGNLHIVNLYKLQAVILLEMHDRPAVEIIDRLTREVYQPYTAFWAGYLGDEAAFRKWTAALLAPDHVIHTKLAAVLDLQMDKMFTAAATWLSTVSGSRPHGTWYAVFGPGWTNMGGLGAIGMVLDFTRQEPDRTQIEFVLPHELTHQAHATRSSDPDAGTVLERIISEGLATYSAYVYAAGRQTAAQSLGYTDEEWTRSLNQEKELIAAAQPYLESKKRKDHDLFASRSQRLLASGPNAAGYFLGFRIMQEYVVKHGPNSWTDAINLPVREVVTRSGYTL